MGKECGARFSRRLWGGSNTSPLKTTAWEARNLHDADSFSCQRFSRALRRSGDHLAFLWQT